MAGMYSIDVGAVVLAGLAIVLVAAATVGGLVLLMLFVRARRR